MRSWTPGQKLALGPNGDDRHQSDHAAQQSRGDDGEQNIGDHRVNTDGDQQVRDKLADNGERIAHAGIKLNG